MSGPEAVALILGSLGLIGSLLQVRIRKTVTGKGIGHER